VTKLERLLIAEVSGVDDPANEVPGWMLMKSAAAARTDGLKLIKVTAESGRTGFVAIAEDVVRRRLGDLEAHVREVIEALGGTLGDADALDRTRAGIVEAARRVRAGEGGGFRIF
jgi:hypothetical protein